MSERPSIMCASYRHDIEMVLVPLPDNDDIEHDIP